MQKTSSTTEPKPEFPRLSRWLDIVDDIRATKPRPSES